MQRWCRGRVPEHVRNEVRVEVDVAERHVTIVECRPPWRADKGVDRTWLSTSDSCDALLAEAERSGESFTIRYRGRPIAVPMPAPRHRSFGQLPRMHVPDDFRCAASGDGNRCLAG